MNRLAPTPVALIVLAIVALATAVGVAAFFVGQSTRDSDSQVAITVSEAEEAMQETTVAAEGKKARAHLKQRVKDVRKVATKRGYTRGSKQGYKKGQEAGYSAGSEAGYSSGYSSGTESGREQGLEEGSDELTCSDDSDVDLPPCFFY